MAEYSVINLRTEGGGYSDDVVTKEELFDSNGKIKDYLIDASISTGVTMTHVCENASDTPYGIEWINSNNNKITGELVASKDTLSYIYMVYEKDDDYYRKYVTIDENGSYSWTFFGFSGSGGTNNLSYTTL